VTTPAGEHLQEQLHPALLPEHILIKLQQACFVFERMSKNALLALLAQEETSNSNKHRRLAKLVFVGCIDATDAGRF
jgi:hypothetical protein